MRRLALVVGLVGLAACEPLRDAFTARPDVAARAGGEVLSVERLSQLAGLGKQVPMQPEAMRRLATVWVDYILFAQAIVDGRPLDDSATVATAMWPAIAQMRWERYHDEMVNQRATVSEPQVDSAFTAGDYRLFQHILLRAQQNAPADTVAIKERQLNAILARARRDPAGFGRLAAIHSEDPGSKRRDGMLGVTSRGAFVPPFENAAWALEPGDISDVVRTPFGVHIIRRPPLAEVRDSFKAGLEERIAYRLDSVFVDSMAEARHLRVQDNAPALVRQLVQSYERSRGSNAALATYTGGRFRVRDFARWIIAMDPSVTQGIQSSPDSQLRHFVLMIAQRQVLLQAAESAGTLLDPDEWNYLRAVHDSALRTLYNVIGLDPATLGDTSQSVELRHRIAVATVSDYLDRVVRGEAGFVPVPPFLADALREEAKWSISSAGLRRALERAQALRAERDTATGVTPAPGPAPIGGGDSGGTGGP